MLARAAAAQGVGGRRYAPGPFDTLVINGTATVQLVQGPEDSVFIEGDDETQGAVDLDLDGGVLRDPPVLAAWKFWRSKQAHDRRHGARADAGSRSSGAADVVALEPLRVKHAAGADLGRRIGALRQAQGRQARVQRRRHRAAGQLAGAVDELVVRISGRGVYLGENLVEPERDPLGRAVPARSESGRRRS